MRARWFPALPHGMAWVACAFGGLCPCLLHRHVEQVLRPGDCVSWGIPVVAGWLLQWLACGTDCLACSRSPHPPVYLCTLFGLCPACMSFHPTVHLRTPCGLCVARMQVEPSPVVSKAEVDALMGNVKVRLYARAVVAVHTHPAIPTTNFCHRHHRVPPPPSATPCSPCACPCPISRLLS